MASKQFRASIRRSVADGALQAALDGNAERRRKGRLSAFESLPDWRERRQRAHAVRAEVINHLEEYLAKFTARAAEGGIIVHRAGDAAEAVKLVLEIARDSPRKTPSNTRESLLPLRALRGEEVLVAKSKSMVSEEIGLNHALEAAGLQVVETDLGEYIVQLRGERPSHIITPAVHLRRAEIGTLFAEKLGIPYTEDIPALTAAARRVLRQVFLTADVGISGVNFGVAETGTLCIVTNEGNGRMVTTLPPLHIALMGIERIVPAMDDLALMLSLLPRSATGQKLTVYTQLIHSPRRPGEADGASRRHLVLVDNGRFRMQQSPLREALYCIRCGACLNACPVFREIGGHAYVGGDGSIAPYPGPIGSVVSPGLLGLEQFGHLAQASSLCGACKDACPVDIDLPRLLTRVRAGQTSEVSKTSDVSGVGLSLLSRMGLRLYAAIASSPRAFVFAQRLGGIAGRIVSPSSEWMRLPGFTCWGYSKDFPRFAFKTFRERFHHAVRAANAGGISEAILGTPARDGKGTKNTKILRRESEESRERDVPVRRTADLVERFTEELTSLGGVVERVSPTELNEKLIEFLGERNIGEVQAWDMVEGLDAVRLREAGIRLEGNADPALKAGITGAQAAIAETGTLVLCSGAGRPLTASLLPEVHIAIVRSSQIVGTLEEALRDPAIGENSATALVTGPSRTADIEMTLTIGVHGPGELQVFLIDDGPAR